MPLGSIPFKERAKTQERDSTVADAQGPTGVVEVALELAAAVGEHALDRPAREAKDSSPRVAKSGRLLLCAWSGRKEVKDAAQRAGVPRADRGALASGDAGDR